MLAAKCEHVAVNVTPRQGTDFAFAHPGCGREAREVAQIFGQVLGHGR
jgi:hypothetical protein